MPYIMSLFGKPILVNLDYLSQYKRELESLRNEQTDNLKVLNFDQREKELLKLIANEIENREAAKKRRVEVARNSFVVIDNTDKNTTN